MRHSNEEKQEGYPQVSRCFPKSTETQLFCVIIKEEATHNLIVTHFGNSMAGTVVQRDTWYLFVRQY